MIVLLSYSTGPISSGLAESLALAQWRMTCNGITPIIKSATFNWSFYLLTPNWPLTFFPEHQRFLSYRSPSGIFGPFWTPFSLM